MPSKIHDNIEYYPERCKQCMICVSMCPVKDLYLEEGLIKSHGKCIKCRTCEKHCPDVAILITD